MFILLWLIMLSFKSFKQLEYCHPNIRNQRRKDSKEPLIMAGWQGSITTDQIQGTFVLGFGRLFSEGVHREGYISSLQCNIHWKNNHSDSSWPIQQMHVSNITRDWEGVEHPGSKWNTSRYRQTVDGGPAIMIMENDEKRAEVVDVDRQVSLNEVC